MSSKQSQKGSRFEYSIRDLLTEKTGVKWDRVPMSGAGSMKGDLYCLTNHYYHCIECKHYADTVIQENLLSAKSNNIYMWIEQCVREATQMNRIPALIFKKDRGKPMICVQEQVESINRFTINVSFLEQEWNIYLFSDWLNAKDIGEIILI